MIGGPDSRETEQKAAEDPRQDEDRRRVGLFAEKLLAVNDQDDWRDGRDDQMG